MSPPRNRRLRQGLLVVLGAMLTALTLVLGMTGGAQAATLFSDDFEDGNATGWSTNGGSWSVATDGSRVYRQSSTSSDARAVAGTASWTDYSVQARVKPTAFNGSNRFVAVLARAQSCTSYYYLALRSNNTVELKRLEGGSSTTLDTAAVAVAAGTWYTVRLDVTGSTLRGYVNGALLAEATDTRWSSGRIGVATFHTAVTFDDVQVSTGGVVEPSGTPSNPPTSPSEEPSQPPTGPKPGRRLGVGERLGPERHHRRRRRASRDGLHRLGVHRCDRPIRAAHRPGAGRADAARPDARRDLRQDHRRGGCRGRPLRRRPEHRSADR